MAVASPTLEKMPPANIDAEQAVLGAILLDAGALVVVSAPTVGLRAEDFFRDSHRFAYEAMLGLWAEGRALDIVTIADELERRGTLALAGGAAYLHSLAAVVPTAIHAPHYAGIVRRAAEKRRLIQVAGRMASIGYDDSVEAEEAIAQAADLVMALGDRQAVRGGRVRDILARMESAPAVEAIGCPLPTLRHVLRGGFRPGNIYVFAGPPSSLKTTLVVDLALHAMLHERAGVIHVTLENPDDELVERYLCNYGQVDSGALQMRRLGEVDQQNLETAKGVLAEMPLVIYDASAVQRPSQVGMLVALAKAHQPDVSRWVVILDYVQLLDSDARHEVQSIDSNMRALQRLAVTEQVALIAVSSLDKESWKSDPKDWSGRGSSSIKGYALFFAGLVPDEEANHTSLRQGLLNVTLQVTKNRRGVQYADIPCQVVAGTGRWREITQQEVNW